MYTVISVGVFVSFLAVSSAIAPNSINLVLETRIRIEPQENISNVLKHVSKLVDKVKYALIPMNKDPNLRAQETKPKKYFTNFLNETVHAIIKLKPIARKSFFDNLYEEIKYYFTYKGSAFADIIKNPLVRMYLVDTLKEWSETNPYEIQRNIKEYMEIFKNKHNTLNKLGDFLNNFYDQKDEVKMKKYVNKLKNCTKGKHFSKVIQAALHNIVIKQYDKMNYTVRNKISDEVNRFAVLTIRRRSQGDKFLNTTVEISNMATNISLVNTSNVNNTFISLKQNTSRDLKGFRLKHPKENVINTEMNITTVSQDTTNNITTSVPYNISNETKNITVIPKAVDEGANNTMKVPQNIKNWTNANTVPLTIKKGTYTSNVPETVKNIPNASNYSQAINGPKITHYNYNNHVPRAIKDGTNINDVPQIIKNDVPKLTNYNYKNKLQQAIKDWRNKNNVPQTMKNGANTNDVPQTIKNVPKLSNYKNKLQQAFKDWRNKNYVPQTIKNGTIKSNVPATSKKITKTSNVPQNVHSTISLPYSRINKKAAKTSKHVNVPKRSKSMKTTPVSILHYHVKSSTVRELRAFDEINKPKFLGKITPRPRKMRKRRKKDGLRKGKRVSNKTKGKKTTSYVPPWRKKQLARQAYEKAHPMDIEDIIDMMHIDRK